MSIAIQQSVEEKPTLRRSRSWLVALAQVSIFLSYGYLGIHRAQLCTRVVPFLRRRGFCRALPENWDGIPAKHLDHLEKPCWISDWRGDWF